MERAAFDRTGPELRDLPPPELSPYRVPSRWRQVAQFDADARGSYTTGDLWRVLEHERFGPIYHCAYGNAEEIYAPQEAVDEFVREAWVRCVSERGAVEAARHLLTMATLFPAGIGGDVAVRTLELVGFDEVVAMASREVWCLALGEDGIEVAAACGLPHLVLVVWPPAAELSPAQKRRLTPVWSVASALSIANIMFDERSGALYARTYGGAYYLLDALQKQMLQEMVAK